MGNCEQDGEPTPDAPQDIHIVSGDNEIKVQNKNFFEYPYSDTTKTINGITFTDNGDGSITINGTATAQAIFYLKSTGWAFEENNIINIGTYTINRITNSPNIFLSLNVYNPDNSDQFYSSANEDITFTVNKIQSLSNPRLAINSGITVNNLTVYPQLEEGSSATSYVKHKEQIKHITLPNGMELAGIGDYRDEFFKNVPECEYYDSTLEEGAWYKYGRIGKVVLNGSEREWANNQFGTNSYQITLDNVLLGGNYLTIISNYFKGVKYTDRGSGADNIIYSDTNPSVLTVIRNTQFSTLNDFKAWLSTHNITVYYALATPTVTEITDTTLIEQLDDIYYTAMSYKGQTNISQTPNDAPFVLDLTALKDLDLVLEDITNAILEIGGE